MNKLASMPLNLLEELAAKYGASKLYSDYLRRYHAIFESRRNDFRRVVEIGLQRPGQVGSSVHMWAEYFPNATIFGLDINPACQDLGGGRVNISIFDSTDKAAVAAFVEKHGAEFDLIIDDGSHWFQDQINTFHNFFPHLKRGGHYVVEDLVSGDGPHRYYTVQAFKELVDGINYIPNNISTGAAVKSFGAIDCGYVSEITGLQFFRDIVFIEKGRNPEDNRFLLNRLDQEAICWPSNSHNGSEAILKIRQMLAAPFIRHLIPRPFAQGPGWVGWLFRRLCSRF
ncbi:hypothetical protein [Ferrovibrio sp.]|uniref:hypothetical protein n=1 Tax=Ferrovibrio sp. TaxID=1917215 RepID=UPI001B5BC0EB|nr:hypothetical protein [Ferrovibrio sp.]MBP7066216.1 hypothetical protein [Ferrovibrio sp.]